MIASGQGALSALKTGCAGLVVALVLAVMLGQGVRTPVHACCYDPPENDSASDQASTPPTAEDAAPSALAPSGDISARSDSSADSDSDSSSPAPRFAMISQMIAEGRYLRARQLAESRLKTRPYDHHLWGLLEQIYQKLGLKGRTADAAFQAKITDPDWRPPVPPPLPASAQKRYVAKLLQAVREFKPID